MGNTILDQYCYHIVTKRPYFKISMSPLRNTSESGGPLLTFYDDSDALLFFLNNVLPGGR